MRKEHQTYEKLYNFKNFGIRNEELVVAVGAIAKLNEFSAIMGLLNLNHIEEVIRNRRHCYERYTGLLVNIRGIRLLTSKGKPDIQWNYFYLVMLIEKDYGLTRDELYIHLKASVEYMLENIFYF